MAAVTLTLIGFFAFIILRVSRPDMGVLFSDLSMQDSASVVRDLDSRGIRYETRGEAGQTILAPRADLAKLRMDLAGKGLPTQGGVGYEIFDKGDAFSSTNFVQNVNHLRALEGELARSIRAIGRVQAARVHLVLPERRLFERDRENPSAAIVLKLMGDLDAGQVRAIRHLVASAVEASSPSGSRSSTSAAGCSPTAPGTRRPTPPPASRTGRSPWSGACAARSRTWSPASSGRAGRGCRSTPNSTSTGSRAGPRPSTPKAGSSARPRPDRILADQQRRRAGQRRQRIARRQRHRQGAGPQGRDQQERGDHELRDLPVTKTEVAEGGRVKRLSVAVVVDGVYATAPDGKQTYSPRPPAELERITALVRSAVGFDKARGDQIEVVNLRFAEAPSLPQFAEPTLIQSLLAPTKEDVLRMAELAVLALLTLIVLLTVVRPLVKQVLAPVPAPPSLAAPGMGIAGDAAAVAGPAGTVTVIERDNPTARLMEFAKINGQVQAETVQRVVDMVRASPAETVEVLRGWIQEE